MNLHMKGKTMKGLLIITLIASAATWAADYSDKGIGIGQKGMNNQPTFSQFDLNNDGKITPKELEEGRAERRKQNEKEGRMMKNADKASSFTDIDTNKDGTISKEEFRLHKIKYPQGCVTFG